MVAGHVVSGSAGPAHRPRTRRRGGGRPRGSHSRTQSTRCSSSVRPEAWASARRSPPATTSTRAAGAGRSRLQSRERRLGELLQHQLEAGAGRGHGDRRPPAIAALPAPAPAERRPPDRSTGRANNCSKAGDGRRAEAAERGVVVPGWSTASSQPDVLALSTPPPSPQLIGDEHRVQLLACPPGVVDELVGRYLRQVDLAVPGAIEGFYVVGSTALGAFRPGRSDVDFVAVVGDRLGVVDWAGCAGRSGASTRPTWPAPSFDRPGGGRSRATTYLSGGRTWAGHR